MKINDEAKVRRSTRAVVLGTAKVMSYQDLEEARAQRAEKEAAKEAKQAKKKADKETKGKWKRQKGKRTSLETAEANTSKGKRGRKRKGATLGAEEPKAKVARQNETQDTGDEPAAESWRAPVAHMYSC